MGMKLRILISVVFCIGKVGDDIDISDPQLHSHKVIILLNMKFAIIIQKHILNHVLELRNKYLFLDPHGALVAADDFVGFVVETSHS
jgi:hypothetical protein